MMVWRSFPRYVPVAERRAQAHREMEKLRKKGKTIEPVEIEGRTIARSFWGKGWCEHLESFSDFENRLPRGRTYARNGSVCHLAIHPGRVEAIVSGSELYHIKIPIKKLNADRWKAIKQQCSGQIGSMLELLQGKLSDQVMRVVTDREAGLFPQPREIEFNCSCPDFATMCKHVAAVLYGIGHRLDSQPDLLFTLRDVDPQELIASEIKLPQSDTPADNQLSDDQLSDVFGIELDTPTQPNPASNGTARGRSAKNGHKRGKGNRARKTSKAKPNARQTAARIESKRAGRGQAATRNGSPTQLPKIRPTGQSVARLRRRMKCSVPQFAEAIGVTPATVYRWESTPGRLRLKEQTYQALAAAHRQAKKR